MRFRRFYMRYLCILVLLSCCALYVCIWIQFSGCTKPKVILLWTAFFGGTRPLDDLLNSTGPDGLRKNCKYKCHFTWDRDYLDVSDALLFHGRAWQSKPPKVGEKQRMTWDIPPARKSSQFYIFYLWENPLFTFVPLDNFANFFNATMTYRRDSDIYAPIGRLMELSESERNFDIPANKTRHVAWIASRCRANSSREALAAELNKFIPVDIYGNCGPWKCSNATTDIGTFVRQKRIHNPCYEEVAQTHKFYLSFENSHCRDYLTEKLWNALAAGMIPIVYGAAEYDFYIPKGSFIDARKYSSMNKLAKYLHYLEKNPEKYAQYFEWRKHWKVDPVPFYTRALCDLCEKLTTADLKPKPAIRDFESWWRGKNGATCSSS